jgi:hypothetical protein
VSGKSNFTIKGGQNIVARILVDEEGNIISQGMTATNVIEAGNLQPITSDSLATSDAMPVNSVAVGNMHSVTSNAVANGLSNINNQLNGYNQSIYVPSPPLITALKNSFLNTPDYSLFSGRNTAVEEMGWYGFKHNDIKGGLAIILNVYGGLTLGMGRGNPDDWTYHRLIYF